MHKAIFHSTWARGVVLLLLTGALAACGGGSDSGETTIKACGGKTSATVGKTFNFSTLAHNVSGTATVIDDCTIELTRFNCDGGGLPDVYVWGGVGGDYRKGFRIGGNLFGVQRSNATERVSLQAGDLDKLDGISIWCERAGASFGDGIFR